MIYVISDKSLKKFYIIINIYQFISQYYINQDKLDLLVSKPWVNDGKNFSSRLWTQKEQMVSNLYNQLVRVCVGGSMKEAVETMMRYLDIEVENKMATARRLINTEMAYFTSEAQKMSYKELGCEQYEIVATLDGKTSHICQDMDGKVFDLKDFTAGITAPPFHPNCRSTTCPYFDDEFSTDGRVAKDHKGKSYKIPGNVTYYEWKNGDYKTEGLFYEVTNTWLDNNKQGTVEKLEEYAKNGKTYKVGENGVYNEHSDREMRVADILASRLGVDIKLLPTVSGKYKNIRTPDYTISGIGYDLKEINKNDKNTLYNKIKDAKGQSCNFVFDIKNKNLDTESIIDTIKKLYTKQDIRFFSTIIIIKDDKVLNIFKRKR